MTTLFIVLTAVFAAATAILWQYADRKGRDLVAASMSRDMYKTMYLEMADAASQIETAEPSSYYISQSIDDSEYRVHACKFCAGFDRKVIVKRFPYSDDPDYALRCAQELLEKLQESTTC